MKATKPVKMIRIAGPARGPGHKIPKLNLVGLLGDARFHNPDGKAFECDVAADPFYLRMIADGDIVEVKPAAPKSKEVKP